MSITCFFLGHRDEVLEYATDRILYEGAKKDDFYTLWRDKPRNCLRCKKVLVPTN